MAETNVAEKLTTIAEMYLKFMKLGKVLNGIGFGISFRLTVSAAKKTYLLIILMRLSIGAHSVSIQNTIFVVILHISNYLRALIAMVAESF